MIINFYNISGGGSGKDYVKTEDFLTSEEVISRALNELHENGGSGSGETVYTAGRNIDITNKVISVTGITVPTNTSDLLNDSGFITDADLNGYATENWVEGKGYLTQHQSLSAYSTTVQVQSMIDGVEAQIPTKTSDLTNDSRFVPYTSDSTVAITGIRVLTQATYDNLVATSGTVNTIIYIIKD